MPSNKDWYPGSRDAQLHLVRTWNTIFAVSGTAWGIPEAKIVELKNDASAAQFIWDKIKSGDYTPSDIVQCNEVFKKMGTDARFIKKHYLLIPPLTLANLPTLLLPLPDEPHTPVPPPTGQPVIAIIYHGGPHLLEVHFAPLHGTAPPDPRSDYGYALYRGIMPQGGATLEQAAGEKHYLMKEPLSGDELLHYRFTRKKKELVEFDAAESGMKVYFCARYENQKGERGAWGPVESAVIP